MPDDEKVEVTEQPEQDFTSEDKDFSGGWGAEKQPLREDSHFI